MEIATDIKNIIFDLGGVLCGLSGERCVAAFQQIGADALVPYVEDHRVEDLFLSAELGQITTHEFCDEARTLIGKVIDDEAIVWAWNELLEGISRERCERLLALSHRYRLFLLSNTNDMHWQRCTQAFFPYCQSDTKDRTSYRLYGADDYFEKTYLSYELHLAKPSEDIFRHVLADAQLTPQETLFIDDSLTNCESAQKLGIQTYHNKNIDDWLKWIY